MTSIVKPGVYPRFCYNHYTYEEQTIIGELKNEWYITREAAPIRVGFSSEYRYLLMKPTDIYREMFNIDREIIVLFADYKSFEPQTFDAFDVIYSKLQERRIDKICVVIISKDADIVDKISRLYKNNQESQIVIPFHYGELRDVKDEFFIRNRFKNFFYTRDLFAYEAPLKKELYFFGRDSLIQQLLNRHLSGENSGLFGLRKTGKTSVIFGLQRALQKTQQASVFIDCQNPAFHKRKWNYALWHVVNELYRQNSLSLKGLPQESAFDEMNAPTIFEDALIKAKGIAKRDGFLLIFDEIENITSGVSPSEHWASQLDFVYFWQSVRHAFQKNHGLFTFIIVGTNPKAIEEPTICDKDNPIFSKLPCDYMPSFTVSQTKEMVGTIGTIMGLSFDESLYGKLTDDLGGHPFLMRHLCSVINKIAPTERPTLVHKILYEKALTIFNEQHSSYVDMILAILRTHYADEYSMLQYLANNDIATFNDFAKASSLYTNHLLGYGILDKHGDEYCFRIESVKHYLQSRSKYQKINLTQEEMLAEICERRNILEPLLRRAIKSQLLASLGKTKAFESLLSCLDPKRRTKATTLNYKDLFDPNRNIIYFSDLARCITSNWNIFQHIFVGPKDDTEFHLNTINKFRNDAHAKDISLSGFTQVRVSFEFIENKLRDFFD